MILNLSLVVLVPISYNLLSYNYAYNHINRLIVALKIHTLILMRI